MRGKNTGLFTEREKYQLTSEAVVVRVRPSSQTLLGSCQMMTPVVTLVVIPPHTVCGTVLAVEVAVTDERDGE